MGQSGADSRSDPGVIVQVGLGDVIDDGLTRLILDVTTSNASGQPLGGGRVGAQVLDIALEQVGSSGRIVILVVEVENIDRSGGVLLRAVDVAQGLPVLAVAGQEPRGSLDIVLAIGVTAHGVELEELTTQVLIGTVPGGFDIVELLQQGDIGQGGVQEIGVAPQGVLAQSDVEAGDEGLALASQGHVNVIGEHLDDGLGQDPVGEAQSGQDRVGHARRGLVDRSVRGADEFGRGHLRPGEISGDDVLGAGVVDALGCQLGVEPRLDPHALDVGRDLGGRRIRGAPGQMPRR